MNILEIFARLETGHLTSIAGVGYQELVPAKEADAGWPLGVIRRQNGDLIVCDYLGHRLWRIDTDGMLHSFAGDGVPGYSGDGGPAENARLEGPHDLAQDRHGNIYVNDSNCTTYRKIDANTGIITRVAGSGKKGRGGDGGLAVDAETDTHCGIAIDEEGNVFISSEWANNIRRIDSRTGVIELFAGYDARHYPSEVGNSRPFTGAGLSLGGYHGDGGPANSAGFYHPEHLAFDSNGDLYVCDNSNDRIRKIDMKTGIITTVLGNGQRASNGDGGLATEASVLMPDAICFDSNDNMYVGEKYGHRIRKVDHETQIVTTLVGTGSPGFGEEGLPGNQTKCNSCESGIWADPDGSVFWGDCSGRLRKYDGKTAIVTTVFGGTTVHDGDSAEKGFLCCPEDLSIGPDGYIYFADSFNQRIRSIDPVTGIIETVAGSGVRAYGGDNGPAVDAYIGNPNDVSVDSKGRIVIADTRHGKVRRVDEDGIIRNVAGGEGQWDRGDTGPAISACLVDVRSVQHDRNDNIFIGDGIGRIRKIDSLTGIINTVAGIGLVGYSGDGDKATTARIGTPSAIRFDNIGNMYFSDSAYHVVRKIDPKGVIGTIAGTGEPGFSIDGTLATEARLDSPAGLDIGPNGEVYISDSKNNRVRVVGTDGVLHTVAGGDQPGDTSSPCEAKTASLNEPHGLCFYGSDILLVSDYHNNRIKAIKLS